jgi:ribosomal protein L29
MSASQLQKQLSSFQDSLLNLKFQKNLQQLENTSQLSKTRRSIAQIKTILNNFDLKKKTNQGNKK